MRSPSLFLTVLVAVCAGWVVRAADYPKPVEGDVVLRDFTVASGESLAELKMHDRILGRPPRDGAGVVRNAVLSMPGTTGSGAQFIRPEFAGELFGAGQPLDAGNYFIVLLDAIGHGQSGKPSDGWRAKFPRYGYRDMVAAGHRMLTEGLGVNHLRLVMGTPMGGMHTWLWGELHPDFMDALMPLASVPGQISGRNRVGRRAISDAIRSDPAWKAGDSTAPPPSLRTALQLVWFMGSNPVRRHAEAPALAKSDEVIDAYVATALETSDANDVLDAIEASRDYDPRPAVEKSALRCSRSTRPTS
jgi:homoserine O-acetyltransferase